MAKDRDRRQKEEELKKRRPVTDGNRKAMVSTLLVNARAAARVATALEPEHLTDWHPGYAELWRCCRDYLGQHKELPRRTVLAELYEEAMQDARDVDGEYVRDALELLDKAYKLRKELRSDQNADWAVRTAQRVSEEAVVNRVREDLADGLPDDLTVLIGRWTNAASQARASSSASYTKLYASGYISRENVQRRTTHQEVLDKACGGQGSAPGWINVFAAPLGGGKTDLCSSTVARFAKHVTYKPVEGEKTPIPVDVIFSFETSQAEYEVRILAHMADVPKDRLVENDKHRLRGMGTQPLDYERRRFSGTIKAGKPIPSEQRRVKEGMEKLSRHVIMIDMSRMDPNKDPNAGTRTSVEMMVATLDDIVRDGHEVRSVWIDHASAMIDDLIATGGYTGDLKSVRTDLLRGMPHRLRKAIAGAFGCDVWLLAQLSGEANSRAPGAKLGLTDLEGCRLLMMYADNGIFMGKYTPDRVAMVQVEKHRHNEKPNDFFVQFDGAFAEFRDVTDHYEYDEGSRKIVKKEDAERAQAARRAPPEGARGDLHTPGMDFLS